MIAEGRGWLDQVLRSAPDEPSSARARALYASSWLAGLAGDLETAKRMGQAALSAARVSDEPRIEAFALNLLGVQAATKKQYEEAVRLLKEAEVVARRHGDKRGLTASIANLGLVASQLGEWDKAIDLYQESLTLGVEWPVTGTTQLGIAFAELRSGREPSAVAARYEEVFRRGVESGPMSLALGALDGLALTAARADHAETAAQVLAASDAQLEMIDYVRDPIHRELNEQTVEKLRTQLGDDAYAAARAKGGTLSPEDAADLALKSIRSGPPAPDTPASHR